MYSSFVIFYTANYCQKIKSFFDIDQLIKSGINVEFWDLSDITVHEHLSSVSSIGLEEIKIRTFPDLINNIKRLQNSKCLYLSFVNFAYFSYNVYRILSKYNVDILYATSGTLPTEPRSKVNRIKRLNLSSIRNIFKTIFLNVIKRTKLFKPAKFVLISCNNAECDYKVSESTEYLSCNSGDYNDFKHIRNLQSHNQIVFIDQYTPYHNDYLLRGLKHIPAEKYYTALNNFFSRVEKKYDAKVVICAHPSAIKYKQKDFFNGRKVVYNESALQIKQSIGVIAQFSTAISYPVSDFKPILLVTTDDMNSYHTSFASFERYLSSLLNIPLINIDHLNDPNDCVFKEVDKNAYSAYIFDYLTTPMMKNKFNADVLISIAKGDYHQFRYEKS